MMTLFAPVVWSLALQRPSRLTTPYLHCSSCNKASIIDTKASFTAEIDTKASLTEEVDRIIKMHWRLTDGVIDEGSEIQIDMHGLPEGSPRPFVGERASAYGEVTRVGARVLFAAMGLCHAPPAELSMSGETLGGFPMDGLPMSGFDVTRDRKSGSRASFVDLGSGAGRLVAQAWLELPDTVERAIGVELAPGRHAAAVRAWKSVCAADDASALRNDGGDPEFVLGSMFNADLSAATHVYVSSLCMSDTLLDQLWAYLTQPGIAPHLEVVASLREFRSPKAATDLVGSVEVPMTWNRTGGRRGTPVFVYKLL
jgi:hypothetical protein